VTPLRAIPPTNFDAMGDNRECTEWVFDNTTIDVNSTTSSGETPIMLSIERNKLDVCKLLIEKGANLFMKNSDGVRAIDVYGYGDPADVLGPQVLLHALDLRWSSVKHLLLLSKSCSSADRHNFQISMNDDVETFLSRSRSARHAATVFAITGTSDTLPSTSSELSSLSEIQQLRRRIRVDQEPDDVKRRIEATLAAAEESNKRARNKLN
jgi:ankyrin repeat protein